MVITGVGSGLKIAGLSEDLLDPRYVQAHNLPDYKYVSDNGLTEQLTELKIRSIVLGAGASLRLENLSFTGVITAAPFEKVKLQLVNCHVRDSLRMVEPHWLELDPGVDAEVSITRSLISTDAAAEEAKNLSVTVEESSLDVRSGFRVFNSTSQIVMHRVQAKCKDICVELKDGQPELQVSQSRIFAKSAFSADSTSLVSVSISECHMEQNLDDGGDRGTAVIIGDRYKRGMPGKLKLQSVYIQSFKDGAWTLV